MKRFMGMLFVVSVVCGTMGCSTWNKLNRTERGAVIGAGSGAIIGNAVEPGIGGTVIGGAAGAGVGGLIGHETDRDRRRY